MLCRHFGVDFVTVFVQLWVDLHTTRRGSCKQLHLKLKLPSVSARVRRGVARSRFRRYGTAVL